MMYSKAKHGEVSEWLKQAGVKELTIDSRKASPETAYFALKGNKLDGRDFIADAFQKGATACVSELLNTQQSDAFVKFDNKILELEKLRPKLSSIAKGFYENDSKPLEVFGVTGTNGKTSCAYFIAQLLEAVGDTCSFIGTIGSGPVAKLEKSALTTPDALAVQKRLKQLKDEGSQFCAMEVSSHALMQHRVDAVDIRVAVFTNLSEEHLDYHKDMEDYYQAKKKLFDFSSVRHAVINIDDSFGRRLYEELDSSKINRIAFSVRGAREAGDHFSVLDQSFDKGIKVIRLLTPLGERSIRTTLKADFNVENILAALASLYAIGKLTDRALTNVENLQAPPGRMQAITLKNGATVIIDFAHSPDALAKVLQALPKNEREKLVCVFGCGGDRDRLKRPQMAKAAEEIADYVIVTDDNPRTENAEQIFSDIRQGFQEPEKVTFLHDRKAAIEFALSRLGHGDCLVVAGKGHEQNQIIGKRVLPFSDEAVVKQWREVNGL